MIYCTSSHPNILFHLRLGLPSSLLLSGFPLKILYAFLISPNRATFPAHLIHLDLIIFVIRTSYKTPHYAVFSIPPSLPPSYPMDTRGSFPRVKSGRGVKLTTRPPSSAEANNAWSYTSTNPIHLYGVVLS
jgi:hypothetical protein